MVRHAVRSIFAAERSRELEQPLRIHVNLDRFLDAGSIQSESSFVAIGLEHELQCVPQVSPALGEGLSLRDGAGDLFDPTHKPSVALGLDDGVVPLLHAEHQSNAPRESQVKECSAREIDSRSFHAPSGMIYS
jgi:hypothetical protein